MFSIEKKKILGLLNPILEQICELLFPFRWPNIYITVFPAPLVDFLQAFVPFILGITTRTYNTFLQNGDVPEDVLFSFYYFQFLNQIK